jgi:glutathione peroxidase-family protein
MNTIGDLFTRPGTSAHTARMLYDAWEDKNTRHLCVNITGIVGFLFQLILWIIVYSNGTDFVILSAFIIWACMTASGYFVLQQYKINRDFIRDCNNFNKIITGNDHVIIRFRHYVDETELIEAIQKTLILKAQSVLESEQMYGRHHEIAENSRHDFKSSFECFEKFDFDFKKDQGFYYDEAEKVLENEGGSAEYKDWRL